MSAIEDRATFSVPEAAKLLGISKAHAYELIKQNRFPVRVLDLGGRFMIGKSELNRYIDPEPARAAPVARRKKSIR